MNLITSADNTIVKELYSLKQKKHRDERKQYFIEGIRFVEEALNESADIERILVSQAFAGGTAGKSLLAEIQSKGHIVNVLSDKLFDRASDTENPQGIIAVMKARYYKLEDILRRDGFLVLLDAVQDPGNLGTIIRTADAAGADGVILSRGCVDLYNPKVLRATMGSVFHIPACSCDSSREAINMLKSKGFSVYGAHLSGTLSYFELDMKKSVALVIGNEANGICEDAASSADMLVKIPMYGRAESLNASVAAGLLMYEVVRQRKAGISAL